MSSNYQNVFVRAALVSRSPSHHYFSAEIDSKHIENYHLNENKATLFPFRKEVTLKGADCAAQIDLQQLFKYPSHRHVLHIRPCKEDDSRKLGDEQIVSIEFVKASIDRKADQSMVIHFLNAELTHDTETFGRMKTYLKMLINNQEVWTSEVDEKGGQTPYYD